MRWFEVRKEPSVPGSSAPPIVMQYQRRDDDDCALPAKRLAISDVRRHAGRERERADTGSNRRRVAATQPGYDPAIQLRNWPPPPPLPLGPRPSHR